jgi:hypothetical protein
MQNDTMPASTPPTDTNTVSSYQLTAVICPINMNANCAQKEMMSAAANALDSIQIRLVALGCWGNACSHGEGGGR